MNRFLGFVFAAVLGACYSETSAEIIVFDFESATGAGFDLDALSSGATVSSSGGISITLTATANGGVFNQVGSGASRSFGINAPGGADDSDAFDGGAVPESMSFTVSSNVPLSDLTLVSFEFDRFGNSADDVGAVTRNNIFLGGFVGDLFVNSDLVGNNVLELNESGILSTDSISLLHAGSQLVASTQGFGLEYITFNATASAAAVPEPSSIGFLIASGVGVLAYRRRRQQPLVEDLSR